MGSNYIILCCVVVLMLTSAGCIPFQFKHRYSWQADGWLEFQHIPATFTEAFLRCKAKDALVASPLTVELRQEMAALFKSSSSARAIFTGIHATFSKGDFASVEGVPLTKIPVVWGPDEPGNNGGVEACTVMGQNETLADVNCNETYPFICFQKWKEFAIYFECDTDDKDYIPMGHKCYKFHKIGRNWRQAHMTCIAEGGHLAIINSADEAQIMKIMFARNPAASILAQFKDVAAIGTYASPDHEIWFTIHGCIPFQFKHRYSWQADGWLEFQHIPATFTEAFLRCKAKDALVASPLTVELRQEMAALFKSSSSARAIFTGIHATFSKGDFASVEGVPLTKIPVVWGPDEPGNNGGVEACTVMGQNETLADVNCNETYPFICFQKWKEFAIYFECDTDDKDYIPMGHKCYKFHKIGRNWRQAHMTCIAEGGHLAIINSADEAQIMKIMFARNPAASILAQFKDVAAIGTYASPDHEIWFTIHGDTLVESGYSNFNGGQPDNNKTYVGGSYCGGVLRNGLLDDIPCESVTVPFICEKEPGDFPDY